MKLAIAVATTVLVGCAANPRIETLTSEQRATMAHIEIIEGAPDRAYSMIDAVEGLSCNRNGYQTANVTQGEAAEGLRIKAAQLGADAVINTVCQTSSDADWKNNCWASVKCIGDAVRWR